MGAGPQMLRWSMMIRSPAFPVLGLCIAGTLIASCAYAIRAPEPLGEPLAIVISDNQSRLVRSQAVVHEELGRAVRRRLGWDLHPEAAATLRVAIGHEDISAAARSTDRSIRSWRVTIYATVTLESDNLIPATRSTRVSGVGYASSRADEPEGLRTAAENLAAEVSDWLETQSTRWQRVDDETAKTEQDS